MDEKVYGGQTMSKRKLLTVILLAFVTTLMLACAIIFTACGNNETPDDGHNTEQGGENPSDGNKPGTNPGTDQDDDKDIIVTSVSLDNTSLSLEIGESYTLVVTVSPSNATDKSITWSSTNSSVAAVSDGKVTAKSEGTTTITAEAHNGKTASCTVTVNEPAPEVIEVTSVSLNKTSLTLEIGESETLTATVLPSNATDKSVTWTSSDKSVVTVINGRITAVGAGAATITAKTSNGKTAICSIIVKEPAPEIIEVTSVSLNKTSLTLEIGASETLTATVLPSNATDKSVTWTSSDQSVAMVVNGKITAIESGTTTITATTSNGKTASCTITVNEPAPEVIEVASVLLNKTSLTLEIGESETITATVLPNNATDKSVTWTSSDQAVATVANGKITAVGSGTAMITATTGNGKTAICTVTVNAAVPKITQVEGATITGTDIFMLVDHMTDSVALLNKITVSSGRWDLYSDILGQNRIPTKIAAGSNGKLQNGDNVFYIMLENENGDLAEVYTLTIYRSYAVTVSYYNHKDVLVYSDTAYTGYEYELNYDYTTPGYTFNSWTKNGITYQSRVLWDDIALHAKMTANSYIVFLNAEGGTLTPSRVDVIYDAEYVLPVPERQGYTFLGWYIDEKQLTDKSGQSLSAWLYAEDSSVMAKWQINQYTVTAEYNEQAGSVTGTGNYDFGTEITLKAFAPNLGYTFSGWYHGSNCLTTETIYTFTLSTEDVNLTAKYDVNDEMSVFIFSSTSTTCTIMGIQDKSVTELIIPDYVTEIEEGAFSGCSSLTSITLPFVGNKIKSSTEPYQYPLGYIFGSEFYNNSIGTIQSYYGTLNNLGTFNIVKSTYYLPASLETVTINGGNILQGAFYNCSNIKSITIPKNITIIEDDTFSGCRSLVELLIPNTVSTIGNNAFYNCSSLSGKLLIPDSVIAIGNQAFQNCNSLTDTLIIPKGVKTIGSDAFSGCSGFTGDLTIPNSVVSIGDNAFNACSNLKSITIPDTVSNIGNEAFSDCLRLIEINYASNADLDRYSKLFYRAGIYGDGVTITFNGDIPSYIFYECYANVVNVKGMDAKSIGFYAFYNCNKLYNITLSNKVTAIGSYAFYGCSALKEVFLPTAVKTIGSYAFYDCNSLMNLEIPYGVTAIEGYAFGNCTSLANIVIPQSVKFLNGTAFSGCSNLIKVINGVSYIDKWVIDCDASLSEITLLSDTIGVGDGAFSGCTELVQVALPNGIISIGGSAFYGCKNLNSITLPDSVRYIGQRAFYGCEKLINYEDGVGYVGKWIVSCNTVSSQVTLRDDVIGIADSAFYACSIYSINIPNTVIYIGEAAFQHCENLEGIIMGNGIKFIGQTAFLLCTSLTSIYITDLDAWDAITFEDDTANPLYYGGTLYLNGEEVTE